jgi:hypothetical protein
MKNSIRPMMILRNNQGDCLRVGFSKQFPKLLSGFTTGSAAARITLQKQAL